MVKTMLKKISDFLSRNNILILLAILIIFFSITKGSNFLSAPNLLNVARQISMDILPALGMTLVLISSGGVDLSAGSIIAMAASLTMGYQPQGVLVSVMVALLFGIAIGILNGLLVTKGKVVPFIATLGTMVFVHGIMLTYTLQQPISGKDIGFTFWGGGSIGPIPTPFIITLAIAGVLYIILKYTQFGRNIYAVGGNEESAFLAGISVQKTRFLTFVMSGFLTALAGVLLASRLNSSSPIIGSETNIMAISAAVLGGVSMGGGKGNVWNTVLGVIAMGLLLNGMNLLGVQTYLQIGVKALILITVVVIDAISIINLRKKLEAQAYGNKA
jgi:ribose transport system permease protein